MAALAVYRLAQLIAWDTGPARVFERIRGRSKEWADTHGGRWENIDEALNCPYCLGVYFAAFCLVLVMRPSRTGDIILYWLGLAGAQAFMQGITKGR